MVPEDLAGIWRGAKPGLAQRKVSRILPRVRQERSAAQLRSWEMYLLGGNSYILRRFDALGEKPIEYRAFRTLVLKGGRRLFSKGHSRAATKESGCL
jgi:hypothetical protein